MKEGHDLTQPSPKGEGYEFRRIALPTGVTLNVGLAGPADAPSIILLHGFPESHRTWRHLIQRLDDRYRLIAPDLRGFAGSDRPIGRKAYTTDRGVADLIALADALGLERFHLVGHDIGGVIAWSAAQAHADRIATLTILNAPHPFIFAKSLIESSDQRRASQYINAFKLPGAAGLILRDLDAFFDQAIAANLHHTRILEDDRRQYFAEWSQPGAMEAMLGWYRDARVLVPPPGFFIPVPDALLHLAGKIVVPTLVIWGMKDGALLPIQLDGLDQIVEQLTIVRLPDAGHFTPWEAPEQVAQALQPFLDGSDGATARCP